MKTNFKNVAAIVMAAGESTRFAAGKPAPFQKVMRRVHGEPILAYLVEVLSKLKIGQIIIVIGHKGREIKKYFGKRVDYAPQRKRLGTADATYWGLKKVKKFCDTVLVINGDDSFRYKLETLVKFLTKHNKSVATLTFMTLMKDNPAGLGRVVRDNKGGVLKVVEEKEATPNEKEIREINCGAYIFEKDWLQNNITKVKPSTVTGEYYIVDLVGVAAKQDKLVQTFKLTDQAEWFGVNTPEELEKANAAAKF